MWNNVGYYVGYVHTSYQQLLWQIRCCLLPKIITEFKLELNNIWLHKLGSSDAEFSPQILGFSS